MIRLVQNGTVMLQTEAFAQPMIFQRLRINHSGDSNPENGTYMARSQQRFGQLNVRENATPPGQVCQPGN